MLWLDSRPSYCTGYHRIESSASNTGSIALREDEVQPPKTAATQSCSISFFALLAKVVGSESPSSWTIWIFLPMMPPAALISLTAMCSEFETVTSEIAIVPDSELSRPSLIVEPELSMQVLPEPP